MERHAANRWHLTPITTKAKSRVRSVQKQHPAWDGVTWRDVAAPRMTVLFSNEPGPWRLLGPDIDRIAGAHESRWIHQTNDPHFTVRPRQVRAE